MTIARTFGSFLVVLAFSIPSLCSAQDIVQVAPNNVKVLMDNNEVRTLEVWLRSGKKIATHSHGKSMLYCLTDIKIQSTLPDGRVVMVEKGKGGMVWRSLGVTDAEENVGDSEARDVDEKSFAFRFQNRKNDLLNSSTKK